mmetsp:Transcript_78913/g.245066  ORF Transcript_78913/g.245066 Transcript_78913/m.245066 type:complete len:313 (+) Transcript_78913:125-1063(+)
MRRSAAACLCVALAAPGVALGLRHTRPEQAWGPPGPSSPGLSRLSSEDGQRQELQTEPLVRKLIKSRERVTIIDVGANEGNFDGKSGRGIHRDPVQDALQAPGVRAVLVEPNPPVFTSLVENVRHSFGENDRIIPVDAAVCANASGPVPFYVLSPSFAERYPKAPHWMKNELSSLSWHYVWWTVRLNCRVQREAGCDELSDEGVQAYVQEIKVPCRTPGALLDGVGIAPGEVNVLKVDAEGYDAGIVQAFLDLEGFQPEIVIFEGTHLEEADLAALLARLLQQGYTTNCPDQGNPHPRCSKNVLASKAGLFH